MSLCPTCGIEDWGSDHESYEGCTYALKEEVKEARALLARLRQAAEDFWLEMGDHCDGRDDHKACSALSVEMNKAGAFLDGRRDDLATLREDLCFMNDKRVGTERENEALRALLARCADIVERSKPDDAACACHLRMGGCFPHDAEDVLRDTRAFLDGRRDDLANSDALGIASTTPRRVQGAARLDPLYTCATCGCRQPDHRCEEWERLKRAHTRDDAGECTCGENESGDIFPGKHLPGCERRDVVTPEWKPGINKCPICGKEFEGIEFHKHILKEHRIP